MRLVDLERYIDEVVAPREARATLCRTGLAWGLVSAGVLNLSFVLPGVMADWGLSGAQAGALAGRTFMGMFVGALLAGPLADRFGRRLLAVVLSLIGGLSALSTAFAATPEAFGLWRFLSGLSFGGLGPVLFAGLCDFCGRGDRGRQLVLLESFWALGAMAGAFWALWVQSWSSWRAVVVFPGLLLPVALLLALGPESPRFLFFKGRREPLERRYGSSPQSAARVSGGEKLTDGPYLGRTILMVSLWAVVSFAYYALFLWLPKIFALSGVGVVRARWFTLFVMAAQLPGYLLAAWSVERFGRVATAVVTLGGTAATALLFLSVTGSAGYLTAAVALSVFCLGAWGVLYAWTPEQFPTSLRGGAGGLTGASARAAGIVAPFFTGWAFDGGLGLTGVLSLVAVTMALSALGAWRFGFETRRREIG